MNYLKMYTDIYIYICTRFQVYNSLHGMAFTMIILTYRMNILHTDNLLKIT